jgi:hypothetical protein
MEVVEVGNDGYHLALSGLSSQPKVFNRRISGKNMDPFGLSFHLL